MKILILLHLFYFIECNDFCNKNSTINYKYMYNRLIFYNFDKFQDVVTNCIDKYNKTGILYLIPKEGLIFDSTFEINKIIKNEKFYLLGLSNFIGFDLNASPFFLTRFKPAISITKSNLDMYLNNTLLTKLDCNEHEYEGSPNIFTFISFATFRTVIYPDFMCP